jgi:hypothetical protein
VTTQYWNGSAWSGGDTDYYRYYTGPTYNAAGKFIGFAHGLKREILPASYSALANAIDPNGTPAQWSGKGVRTNPVRHVICAFYHTPRRWYCAIFRGAHN